MKLFFTIAALCLTLSSYGQTQKQTDLVSSFFSYYGKAILQDMAHPVSTCVSSTVASQGGGIYSVALNYEYASHSFTCEYRLTLDDIGNFLRLSMQTCGHPDVTCFTACRFANFKEMTTRYDRERYEHYVGKNLDDMTCEQYARVKLYFEWVDKNYASRY